MFLPSKLSVPRLHSMGPDSLFFWFWVHRRQWPQNRKKKTKKKTTPDTFLLCKCIFVPSHPLYVSLPFLTVVLRMCTIPQFLYNNVDGVKNIEKRTRSCGSMKTLAYHQTFLWKRPFKQGQRKQNARKTKLQCTWKFRRSQNSTVNKLSFIYAQILLSDSFLSGNFHFALMLFRLSGCFTKE